MRNEHEPAAQSELTIGVGESNFVAGGGEMGALIRSIDWTGTALGALSEWPQSLRTAASIMLQSRFPMYIAWGPRYIQLYNDGYRPILGTTKHPAGMGQPAADCFRESWDIIGPMFDGVIAGSAVGSEDWFLPLDRHGYLEECYFTFSYSPIREESGSVGGVLVTVTETTRRVLGERRLSTLSELTSRTLAAETVEQACQGAAEALAKNPNDLPFAIVYLLHGDTARAVSKITTAPGLFPDAASISMRQDEVPWPLRQAVREPTLVENVRSRMGGLPGAPDAALILPLTHSSGAVPYGFLVAGVSPKLALDDDYRAFLALIASGLSAAIAAANTREEQRRHASELAQLDRAKTTFFSNVSHELRTPLTLILGPIQDMLATPPDSKVDRNALDLVHRNSLRLLKLVNTLLDFSRIEAGRVEAVYEAVDLSEYTSELASSFRSVIERAGLQLVVDCPTLPEPVYIDRDMWEKIVLNLLSNAFKFTFVGSISVRLELELNHVRLDVADTGTGIAADELPRLFDRFHRVAGVQARTHEGSGIGLALVQELARMHGGDVRVTSRHDEGSTFSVSIPRGSAHLPANRLRLVQGLSATTLGAERFVQEAAHWGVSSGSVDAAVDRPPASRAEPVSQERILLADDNSDMRDYVARLLRDRWSVEAVGDGVAALASARSSPPDLVICDVMMPGLDGLGLIRALRSAPATGDIPVIILSARAGEVATTQGLESGANHYIAKPFSKRDLLARVGSTLTAARISREINLAREAQRANLYRHFMQAPFPIAVMMGPRHVVELANPPTLISWGKSEEIIGLPLEEGVPELRGQPFLGWLDDVYGTGVAHEGKEELARLPTGPNGELQDIYCNFVYAPLRDTEGRVEGILLSAFVVTEQVLARQEVERALARAEASESQFRELVENLPGLAWNARPDGHIDFYNRRWYEYTGTTLAQMEGWGWQSVHHPDTLPAVVERLTHCLQTGRTFEMEFPLRRADGVFRWFLTRAIPLRDSRGNIIRWFGTNTDVDDVRRERERVAALAAQLSQASQRLQAAQRAASIGIFDWDLAAGTITGSPEVHALMGLATPVPDTTPAVWSTFVFTEDRAVAWEAFQVAIAARQKLMELELRLCRPLGEPRWVRLSTEIEYTVEGSPSRALGAVVDIQALKEAAVVRLTALEEAERISRAKDEFLATMSHELRTPLNAMLGWAKLLRGGALDPKRQQHGLAVIQRNAESQSRLISDLLDVSRVISGKLRLVVANIDTAAVVLAAIDVVRQAADAKGIRIISEIDPMVGSMVGDADRLQQIVWNLLSNAVKFTPTGGRILVIAKRQDSSLLLSVTDNGAGISAADLPLIFERFQQVDSSVTRAHGGLGLGLAIVRHLVEAHGGTVTAESRGLGTGATFNVKLPLRAVFADSETKPALLTASQDASAPASPPLRRLAGVRILAVDDDVDSLDLIRTVLEDEGALVRTAQSGNQALEAAVDDEFDLIVSDIGMPEMDGLAFARALRARHQRTPAIALTAYARAEDARQAQLAGYHAHFAKPVDASVLVAYIQRLLSQPE